MTPEPSSASRRAVDAATCALSKDALVELGDLIASLGRSAAEAAWRGSSGACRMHFIEIRETLKLAAETLKQWESCAPNDDGRAP